MRKILLSTLTLLSFGVFAQTPTSPTNLQLLGTRSWIRLNWTDPEDNRDGYHIYWSTKTKKPSVPNATVNKEQDLYYIQDVIPETTYSVWVEAFNSSGNSNPLKGKVITERKWRLVPEELEELSSNPGSTAIPKGMQLFWHDEFNDQLLNRNKWSTNYYSSIDHLRGEFQKDMLTDNLPQPAYKLNGRTINLFVSDSLPKRVYDQKNQKKISSIQTYDWRLNENLLDNSRGGYYEVKVKRSSSGKPRGLNTAFWFDSPGPDLRNYLERGTVVANVEGIRPPGQVFEIDVFENLDAQFVLHGHVDKNGRFVHNLATHIAKGYTHADNWVTHGILWTPISIKHYINGDLIKEYIDKHKIYSPNHFMNVFLGSYGGGGTVNMEVDYIRGYQWPLKEGNELPNPGFEDGAALLPWEGTAEPVEGSGRNKSNGVLLKPGQMIEQYVYLNNNTSYKLEYWFRGEASIEAVVHNVAQVTGGLDRVAERKEKGNDNFIKKSIIFKTGKEYGNNMKTVRIAFKNTGVSEVVIDDITARKK